jgi:uncharacterized protein (UPF0264 family)
MELLVSVRNESEAAIAARLGVRWIDLKEPDAGSLGAPAAVIARNVAMHAGGHCSLSIALGELRDFAREPRNELRGYSLAKIGWAGMADVPDRAERWRAWRDAIGKWCRPVVVAYADHRECDAPAPEELAMFAANERAAFWLIDTCIKDGRTLLEHISVERLRRMREGLQRAGVGAAFAGSLNADAIRNILDLRPDVIAVRGAACANGNRRGVLDGRRIAELQELLRTARQIKSGSPQDGEANGWANGNRALRSTARCEQ